MNNLFETIRPTRFKIFDRTITTDLEPPVSLAIAGSRDFKNSKAAKVIETFLYENRDKIREVVSGGARGIDKIGEEVANSLDIPTKILVPDWKRFGKRAGMLRNADIEKASQMALIFWDGASKGTQNTIQIFTRAFKPVVLFDEKLNWKVL